MENKIKLIITGLGLAAIACFIMLGSPTPMKNYEYSEDYVQIKELPAMLDFYYYTAKEWETKLAEEDFGEIVTSEVVEWILRQTGSTEYITYDSEITRSQWNKIYDQLLDLLDEDAKVEAADVVILKKESDTLVCPSGTYSCKLEDISIEPMTAMGFYIKEDSIIGIRSLKSASASISNVFVKEAGEEKLEFLAQGEQYELALAIEEPEKIKNHVCDLLWEDGVIARLQVKEDTIQGNLIAVNDDTIEIEGYGQISRSENLPVYKIYGTVEEKTLSDIVIANMKVEYVVAEERVEAILLVEPAQISRIRVLLLDEDGGTYREEVYIGASTSYLITNADGSLEQSAETIVKASELFGTEGAGSISVTASEEGGELFLCDESGSRISKGYQGSFELRRYKEGYAVVNELPIEQYLCSVVPSEMPVSYEAEALKAQAICARSYAYIQLENGDYAAFGAHVDDTTNYQVYNKQDRDEKTTAAVLDTAGMVIRYNGETANAYYFSTSAGITGNGDAWNLTADPKYGYLQGSLIKEGGGQIDLSSEEAFGQFIAEADTSVYECAYPYFRWKAIGDYTSDEVRGKIAEIINTRIARTPQDIILLDKKGEAAENVKGFGKLLRLSITKRSASGVILQLQLEYKKGTALIGNEYNIRALLGAGITDLTLADGSKKESALLPSAYTTLVPLENGTYSLDGGGYGHGIGMSQNGAQAMALNGKSYEEILKFFFYNIEIANGDS